MPNIKLTSLQCITRGVRMNHVGLFSLLLLICCLPGAELQDTELTENEKQSLESLNVPDQRQSCPSDIHAVLREMSAALAEQRVWIEQLQTENQGQADKQTVETLKQQLQAQAAELSSIKKSSAVTENQVEALTADQAAQAAELSSIKKRSNVTENQVEALMKDRAVTQVAFSASLLASGEGTIGPFNTHTPLLFRRVVSNIGNAYNSNTGLFTAPVKGAYHFEFYIGAHGHSYGSGAVLVKNGEHIFIAYEHETSGSGYGSSANGATLLLEAGDVVFLKLWQNTRIFDNENHHSTFSGHLLFTM